MYFKKANTIRLSSPHHISRSASETTPKWLHVFSIHVGKWRKSHFEEACEDLSPWWAHLKGNGHPEMGVQPCDVHSQFCALTVFFFFFFPVRNGMITQHWNNKTLKQGLTVFPLLPFQLILSISFCLHQWTHLFQGYPLWKIVLLSFTGPTFIKK
jgi:hypothetical protein